MACELLDLRCIFVNELVGTVTLSLVVGAILYFVFASKAKLGFETTLAFAVPLILLLGIAIGGITAILAFLTVGVGILIAYVFNKIIGNR